MPDQCAITAVPPSPASARVVEVSDEGANLLVLLFPQLAGVRVHRLEDTEAAIVISASCTASSGCCPACGSVPARVHGGYSRTVADGAAGGRPVLIMLRVLRFRCVNPSCAKATFAMQSDGLTSRYCAGLDGATLGEAFRAFPRRPAELVRAGVLHLLWAQHLVTDLSAPLSARHRLRADVPVEVTGAMRQ